MNRKDVELVQKLYSPSAASLAQSIPHMIDSLTLAATTLAGCPVVIHCDHVLHRLEAACHAVQRLRRQLVETGQ
jgi:hypothetical protein